MKGIEGKESLKAKGRRHETELERGERARPVGRGAKTWDPTGEEVQPLDEKRKGRDRREKGEVQSLQERKRVKGQVIQFCRINLSYRAGE